MQAVEGCFNAGRQNTDEAPDYPWNDLIGLGSQADMEGQGAFSTFTNTWGDATRRSTSSARTRRRRRSGC